MGCAGVAEASLRGTAVFIGSPGNVLPLYPGEADLAVAERASATRKIAINVQGFILAANGGAGGCRAFVWARVPSRDGPDRSVWS